MRYLLTAILSLWCISGFTQQISYVEWKKEALENIRLLPEYGHKQKDKEQIAADNELIETMVKQEGSREKGSEALIKLGFTYLYQGDVKTAMYRFNQAYLLNPKNENIYWGYGAVYGFFNDYASAITQYDRGLTINPKSSVILTDKATLYFVQFQKEQGKNPDKLRTALSLLQKSYAIDKSNQNTLFKLSVCNFLNKNCNNAWKYYDECMKLGGNAISNGYAEALKSQCSR